VEEVQVKGRRGLSSVMGSLLLIIIVFLAWAFLYSLGLNYLHIISSTPAVSVKGVAILMNYESLQNPGTLLLELYISNNGYTPFVITKVIVSIDGKQICPTTFYSAFVNYKELPNYQETLPITIRQAYTQLIYTFIPNEQISPTADLFNIGNYSIVTVIGNLGSSTVQVQTSVQVVGS
jgi:FlaG/FlaF family flagellin (archaellin)